METQKILTAINSVNDEVVTIILFALGIFATLISYFISSRIMEKKEFLKKDSCRFFDTDSCLIFQA